MDRQRSLRERAALAIDTEWKCSRHWPDRDWEADALEQAEERVGRSLDKIAELRTVIVDLRKAVAD